MFFSLPTVQTFCDFELFIKPKENERNSHFERIEKMKEAARASMEPTRSGWIATNALE